jgi:hypothetical protein
VHVKSCQHGKGEPFARFGGDEAEGAKASGGPCFEVKNPVNPRKVRSGLLEVWGVLTGSAELKTTEC